MFILQFHFDFYGKFIRFQLRRLLYIITLLLISFQTMLGQATEPDRYVQVSGLITDQWYQPVQGAAVISHKLRRGTVSERTGIFLFYFRLFYMTQIKYKLIKVFMVSLGLKPGVAGWKA